MSKPKSEPQEPAKPHDALFRHTFSQVGHAAAELRAVLPRALAQRIDFSTLTLCSGSYVDQALRGSQSDLLFSAKLSGRTAFLYLLFEHQSGPDVLMPLRVLGYMLRILEDHVKNAASPREALPLPVVVPVVLHHGDGGWSAARRVEDLFDAELVEQAGLHELIPRLSFVLDDLSSLSDEALEARQLALEPLLALWALRDARSRFRLEAAIEHWVPLLAQLWDLPQGRQALWTLFRYILAVADETAAESLSEALQARKPEAQEAIMTLAEKWFTQGEAKGKAEGKTEGKAESLRKLLTLKFGELPPSIAQRIAASSEPDLDRFIERVLSTTSLDQVFE